MNTQPEITPEEFAQKKAEYRAALKARARMIMADIKTMTQQATADKWGVNFSLISRIVKKMKEKKGAKSNV